MKRQDHQRELTESHLRLSTQLPFLWFRATEAKLESEPQAHFILSPKWKVYDVRATYERAQRKHDPYLAPHGFFRKLKHGNNDHAKEFLDNFGPLEGEEGYRLSPHYPPAEPMKVDLNRFWHLHLMFIQAMRLWESRYDQKTLSSAWREIADKYSVGRQPLFDPQTVLGMPPWEGANLQGETMEKFDFWAKNTTFATQRTIAFDLVHKMLNSNTTGVVSTISWETGWEKTGEKFRPVIRSETLWAMIWEFFGFDTAGMTWRRCPHCQQLFYPKRRDQFYCTRRQQTLASKRAYAVGRRAAEKKKLKSLRRVSKGAKQ